MEKLSFEIVIHATAEKLWQVLWNNSTYRNWTSAFAEGSYAVTDWKEGSKVHFLTPSGRGMYGIIASCIPNSYMALKHMGEIKNFEEQIISDGKTPLETTETYALTENNGVTTLTTTIDAIEPFKDYFNTSFPKAMALLKEIAENPVWLTVTTKINLPVEKIWEYWTGADHIKQWNQASPDWHTTAATNDLQEGGAFSYRMEAKDGSFGFDFSGKYTCVLKNEKIAYTMDDGRKAVIDFIPETDGVLLVEKFEAETENSLDLQEFGWQSILNSFKNYVTLKS